MKRVICLVPLVFISFVLGGCVDDSNSTKQEQRQQEQVQKESIAQSGIPAIKNFREKKLLKQIYELRDQDGVLTYTYIVAENTGKLIFLGETIGYGIPAATQYNNPQKPLREDNSQASIIQQADPNGLYSPASAEGTWIMLKDPNGKTVKPVYVEPRIIVSPFKLEQ
jgi:hypothetical protein